MPTDDFAKKKQRHASGESTVSTISTYIPVPPDGGYGWVIVVASFFNHIVVDGITFTFGVFYPEFVDYFGESRSATALVGSLQAGCYFLGAPIASALINKYGCRPVCNLGAIIAALAFVVGSFSQSLNFLMVTYGIIGGIGLGFIYLPSIISVTYYFHNKRAFATGIACCGAGVGTFLFAPIGRLLLDTLSWRGAMVVEAGILLNTALFGMLLRPLAPAKKARRPRRKNLFDRLKEKAKVTGDREEESGGDHARTCAAVEKARAVREALIKREELEQELDAGDEHELEEGCDDAAFSSPEGVVANGSAAHPAVLEILVEDQVDGDGGDVVDTKESSALINGGHNVSGKNKKTPTKFSTPTVTVNDVKTSFDDSPPKNNGVKIAATSLPAGINYDNVHNPKQNGTSPVHKQECDSTAAGASTEKRGSEGSSGSATRRHSCGAASGKNVNRSLQSSTPQKRSEATAALKVESVRPMYRKDIFLSGSLLNIVQFRSTTDIKSFMRSMTSIPPQASELDNVPDTTCGRLLHMSTAVKHVLREMLDFSLFADPIFIIAGLANAFGMFALFTPFIYFVDRAVSLEVPMSLAAYLLSVIGVTNIIGRLGAGFVASIPRVNSLVLHNASLLLMGFTLVAIMFCRTFATMCIAAVFFGLGMAAWISLTSIILCNLMGLEKLTNAFGLLTMIRGIAVICGPPVAGKLYEQMQDYDITFVLGGITLLMSGLLFCCLHLPFCAKYRKDLQVIDDMEMAGNTDCGSNKTANTTASV